MSDAIFLALMSMMGAIIAGFFKMIDSQSKAQAKLTDAVKEMADSSKAVAEATETGNREAKERNGHLGEQNIQIAQLVTSQNKDVSRIKDSNEKIATVLSKSALIAAEDRDVLTGGKQVVHEQVVEHQIVREK